MKLNITTIPEEGLKIRFSLAGDQFSAFVSEKGQFAFSLGGVEVAGEVRKSRQSIIFTGLLETVLEADCCRCLEKVFLPIKTDFRNIMLPEIGTAKEDTELQAGDLDVAYYTGEVIDLSPMIVEQVILQIPMKVLCRESCRGLCPQCGINLNLGTCCCRSDFIDPRLAALKKFKM